LGETERNHGTCSGSQSTAPPQRLDRRWPPKTLRINEGPLGSQAQSRRRRLDNEGAGKKETRPYRRWSPQTI
jgi:hypothetical protein